MKRPAILTVLLLTALSVMSQISVGGMPYSFKDETARTSKSRFLQLGAADDFFTELNADTVRHDDDGNYKALYVGNVCSLDISPESHGRIFRKDGNIVWRAGVTSKGAASIGLVFTEFNIPDGAKLFLYNPGQTIVLGAFTAENNNNSDILPVQPLASDSVIVEYIEPAAEDVTALRGKLRIGRASHNFYDIGELRKANPNKGNKCTPHVNQDAYDNPFKNASCAMFISEKIGKAYFGSGQLINNPDKLPYVISAAHLFSDAEDMTQTVFYFQYQTPKQDTLVIGSMELTIAGATPVAYDVSIDMAFMRLNQVPPRDYRPYLAGWDASESQYGPLTCIQHPNGDFAKVSFSNNNPVKSKITFQQEKFPYQCFWKVGRWRKGCTQSGSSGSALLNPDNRIIGTLTGGSSDCTSPINDYYSQLSVQFNFFQEPSRNLKSWLDPHDAGITQMDGEYLYHGNGICERMSNTVTGDKLEPVRLNGGQTGYQAGSNSLGYTEYAEKYEFDDDMTICGVYVMTYKGTYNASNPVYVNIYTKNSSGYTLASQTLVKPIDYSYTYDGNLQRYIFTDWTQREIYVRLAEPVNVGSECLIGVQKSSLTQSDSIALYQTSNRTGAEGNTAYYKSSGAWKPFTEYPVQAMPASLWIEPVVNPTNPASADETESQSAKAVFSVFPNPADRYITIVALEESGAENTASYQITDISGRVVRGGSTELYDGRSEIEMPDTPGIYMLALTFGGKSEVHKVIKK